MTRAKRNSDNMRLRHPDAAHRLRARMWQSAHPEAVARVAKLIGGDDEMAAFMLAGHDGTVDSLCAKLEEQLLKLMGDINRDAKRRAPVDTGELRRSARTRR